jgi:beta-phosphoglucomutase-like phosphatase (HAD superfamily)
MVIEDSRNGLIAAMGAGMPCLITTSTYTADEDFNGAVKVVPELGDPPDVVVSLSELGSLATQQAG